MLQLSWNFGESKVDTYNMQQQLPRHHPRQPPTRIVNWFRRLPVVPHTLAPPAASATGWCHWGEQVLRDALYALEGKGWRWWGKEGEGGGRVGLGWGGVWVRKERGRRAILSYCGALSDFGPDPAGCTFRCCLKLLCGPPSGPVC